MLKVAETKAPLPWSRCCAMQWLCPLRPHQAEKIANKKPIHDMVVGSKNLRICVLGVLGVASSHSADEMKPRAQWQPLHLPDGPL